MRPTFGDFTTDPARLGNSTARYEGCHPARDHLEIDAGGSVELDFTLDDGAVPAQATLTVTALVSLLGKSLGHAPVDVTVNGRVLIADFTIPGGAIPQDTALAVPGELLVPGTNTLRLRSSADAHSMLWLYRITLDPCHAIGGARRAMAEEAAREAVFAFRAERRAVGSASWRPAPRLLVHLDRGEHSPPGQLAWRGQDGAEAAVSFQSAMTDFYGHYRAADGSPAEYRGRLEARSAFPEGTDDGTVHRFRTEEGWGGGWHASGELRLLVEDGGAPVERVTWRDQAGNSGSVSLRAAVCGPDTAPASDGFIGYYQRVNEGPIGYRGASPSVSRKPETAAARLSTVEQWRSYLAEYSADVLRVADESELTAFSEEQRAAGWLGYEGAGEDRVAALEDRLGTRLPPSFRAFLGASDGWRHLSAFMYELLTADTVDWLRDAMPGFTDDIKDGADDEELDAEFALMDRSLLISGDADAQYWLLDPGDVSEDGEWAAYIWASWYPGLGDRHASFAELVAAERTSFEELKGHEGHGVHPEGAEELVAKGRAQALRGEVEAAMATFEEAAVKGSGAGAYLKVVLGAFLDRSCVHHDIRRGVLHRPHVIEAVGLEQVRAEVAPLFLRRSAEDWTGAPGWYISTLGDVLPALGTPGSGDDTADWIARAAAFVPPVLPESPAFQQALDLARTLARQGDTDESWTVIETALPHWHSDSPHRIAPVILLTDPVLGDLITPHRARRIVTMPRGEGSGVTTP